MTELEKLTDYAYNRSINIHSTYSNSNQKGCCFSSSASNAVMINENATEYQSEKLCTVAEEIGHIVTGASLPVSDYLNPHCKKWQMRKNEVTAERWAIKRLLPTERIQAAIDDGCVNLHEIAEHLSVTVEFLEKAFDYYERKRVYFTCE